MLAFSIAIAISLFVFIMMTLIVLRQSDSQREMQRRLDQFMDPSAEEEMVDPDDLRKIPFLQRTVGRVLGDLMDTLSYFAPAAIPKLMERRIMLAGKQGVWKVAHFAGLWFLCLALGLALGFWYAGRGVYTAPQFFLIVLGWGFMGGAAPLRCPESYHQETPVSHHATAAGCAGPSGDLCAGRALLRCGASQSRRAYEGALDR